MPPDEQKYSKKIKIKFLKIEKNILTFYVWGQLSHDSINYVYTRAAIGTVGIFKRHTG
jgi:hypothetical protein